MRAFFTLAIHSHAFYGAMGGFITAASTDFQSFKQWKSFHDAATYDWSVAAFRWVQGAVIGAVTASGIGTMFPDIPV